MSWGLLGYGADGSPPAPPDGVTITGTAAAPSSVCGRSGPCLCLGPRPPVPPRRLRASRAVSSFSVLIRVPWRREHDAARLRVGHTPMKFLLQAVLDGSMEPVLGTEGEVGAHGGPNGRKVGL